MLETTTLALTLTSFLICAYAYAGFPLLMLLMSKVVKPKPLIRKDICPRVTLVISCYNEATVIENKLRNSLALNYPSDRFEIVVVSDGSTDDTDAIVRRYEEAGVRLVRVEGRVGKTMGLNRALETIRSEVVVFSDANAIYQPDAIRRLVRSFADPGVGYVVGAALYSDGETSGSARSESTYWSLEIWLKVLESRVGFVVGGDGALYAIRRCLWQPMAAEDINDFVNPLQIVAQGYRGVFEPEAICYERTAGGFSEEARRKRRIVNRSFRGLWKMRQVLNPFTHGFFSIAVVSHKLLRWMAPALMVIGVSGSMLLALRGHLPFALVTLGAALFATLALLGQFLESKGRHVLAAALPYYFVVVNWNGLLGMLDALRGQVQVTWRTARDSTAATEAAIPWLGLVGVVAFWLAAAYTLAGAGS